ncbi:MULTISPECIES: hypothetical protein [unclassified Pauljensenia]|uniref:hypothetical protein n=1 Tax=unclassified Pauljensenia TaxID=2908895 RepID=UPI00330560B0
MSVSYEPWEVMEEIDVASRASRTPLSMLASSSKNMMALFQDDFLALCASNRVTL